MTAHAFKKTAPQRFSFVAAVKKYGDAWSLAIPLFSVGTEDTTQDLREFAQMAAMERGTLVRVGALAERSGSDIVTDFNGLVYTATRKDHDMDDPVGFDERSKFRAIADLLDAEELRAA